jgi:predicted regulator of Ras-like GTPase activity (Roadblock/LC7/MglB family)
VSSNYRSEMRGFLLISCFIMVVPLILFPRDFGIKLNLSLYFLLALELGWYALTLFILFPRESASRVLPFAMITLSYRNALGLGFTVLLLTMFSLSVTSALKLGIHLYAPAVLLQAIMAPFVLKSIFGVYLKNRHKAQKTRVVGFQQETEEDSFSPPPEMPEDSEPIRSFQPEKESKVAVKTNLQSILHYLREYAGVKAALLFDQEGLVVASDSRQEFDAEKIATFSRHLKDVNDKVLLSMGEKPAERIGIHTSDLWMNLYQIGEFTLAVLSERRTDELLSVRITQSTVMIERFLVEKYQLNVAKKVVEAQHV